MSGFGSAISSIEAGILRVNPYHLYQGCSIPVMEDVPPPKDQRNRIVSPLPRSCHIFFFILCSLPSLRGSTTQVIASLGNPSALKRLVGLLSPRECLVYVETLDLRNQALKRSRSPESFSLLVRNRLRFLPSPTDDDLLPSTLGSESV